MSKIDAELVEKLERKLGVGRRQIYNLISEKVNQTFLPRNLAAVALAAEQGIGVAKYTEELAQIRQTLNVQRSEPVTVTIPSPVKAARPPRKRSGESPSPKERRRGNSVFVIHGRNENLRKSIFGFLRAVHLQPIEWGRAIKLTGKPNPYIAEVLDAAFREAAAVVVLLSADDEAKLRDEFVKQNDPPWEKELTGQARPNVLFEAGMALGRNPDSTVIVQVGDVRPFSDVAGKHILRLSNSPQSRQDLITRLANAGCNVQADGTDWYSEGDFEV